jgi:small subunit ribosomal protein S17
MAKIITGKVVSIKMNDTVVVEVTRFVPHPLYKKLMKRSKNFKVAVNGHELSVGKRVKMEETKPMSKDKYFKVIEVLAEEHEKPSIAKAKDGEPAVAKVKIEEPVEVKAKAVKATKKEVKG